jgi:hypothetical protein
VSASYSPGGRKSPEAPENWPFGTQDPPETGAAAADAEGGVIPGGEPLVFLQAVIDNTSLKLSVRMQAAAIAAPFKHAKPAPIGKKGAKNEAAKQAGGGKFASAAPPKLGLVKSNG